MFAQWQSAKRARDYVTADKLREELRQLGVDAGMHQLSMQRDGRPSRAPVVQAGEGSSDGARMEELLSQRSGYQEPGPPQQSWDEWQDAGPYFAHERQPSWAPQPKVAAKASKQQKATPAPKKKSNTSHRQVFTAPS